MAPSVVSRRDLLKWSAAAAGSAALARAGWAADPPAAAKKVLFFTKSAGFQHDMVKRPSPDELAPGEQALVDLGKSHGLDVTCSKDGSLFTPAKLAGYDVIAFYTTGDLTHRGTDGTEPMPAGGKQALLDFVAAGKGFVGIHSASDTFHSHGTTVDPYLAMLGGEFVTHGDQQQATQHVADAKFPGAPAADVTCTEEWYILTHLADDLHAILIQDTHGMKGAAYHRPNYPATWARRHGKGRVFYTAAGHRAEVWAADWFTALLAGGLRWSAGLVDADVAANLPK